MGRHWLRETWRKNRRSQAPKPMRIWDGTRHVLHFHHYKEEGVSEVKSDMALCVSSTGFSSTIAIDISSYVTFSFPLSQISNIDITRITKTQTQKHQNHLTKIQCFLFSLCVRIGSKTLSGESDGKSWGKQESYVLKWNQHLYNDGDKSLGLAWDLKVLSVLTIK